MKKKSIENFFAVSILDKFFDKNVQIWDLFFPLIFPNDSESLKMLDFQKWGQKDV